MSTLEDLLTPESVAVVGASDDPTRIGGRPISFFKKLGYPGRVYPVNPNRDSVQGIPAYPSLKDIPEQVDFALIAVPAQHVVNVVRDAVARSVKTVMIFSSGFGETSEAGQRAQDQLTAIARTSGVRIIGPNCLGVFNAAINFYPTFTATVERARPTPGGLAIASQSGAYGSHIFFIAQMRGLDMTYWVTTGNECDVHVAEVIKMMAEAEDVHAICAYAESIKDGDVLVEGLEKARAARKPVIFMKVGRSAVGAAAANSHTASLAGEDSIYDAVLKQCGAFRARTTEEALDIAYAARPRIYPTGRRIGLVTISGGGGVLMADAASDRNLDVAPMPEDAQAEMKELVPFAAPNNPVDVTAQFFNDLTLVPKFTKLMLERGNYDALVGFWTSVPGSPTLSPRLLTYLREAMAGQRNKLFIQSLVAPEEIRKDYETEGFPCFEDPSRAVAAAAALIELGVAFDTGRPEVPTVPKVDTLPEGPLSEREAKHTLKEFGIPTSVDTLVASAEEAAAAAKSAGQPVAIKIVSADIGHKTDVGGVQLDIDGEEAAQTAFREIFDRCRTLMPQATIDGMLVTPMAPEGVDCILGAKVDPVFGAVVMFGLGGVFAEILGDVSFRKAPVNPSVAREMIDDLKGSALLRGARGSSPTDLEALCDAISRFSVFAAAHADELESAEINPLRALPEGCIGLDALIVKKR